MAKIDIKNEASSTPVPPSGYTRIYAKNDKTLYYQDDTGIETPIAAVTNEQIQDAVGSILTNTQSIDMYYDDVGNTISASAIPAGINHDALSGWMANNHVNHASVSINAGTGLTGGGDITTSRTLSIANTTVSAASYGSASSVPTYSVNAQGQLTSALNVPIQISESQVTNLTTDLANRALTATTVNAGSGLIGGGDLSTNRIISMPAVGTSGIYGSISSTNIITTDVYGRISNIASSAISISSTQISDFNEAAQDAVGTSLLDSGSIDFTYNDVANAISATVIPGGVNHNALSGYVANEHINHSSVNIIGASGLTGSGNITSNVSLGLPLVGTSGTYGATSATLVLTTDQYGRTSNLATTAIQISESQVTNLVSDLANKQPLDSDLTALAALTGTGIITRTATDTYNLRSISGASGVIVVNGDGISGNLLIRANLTSTPPPIQNLTDASNAGSSLEVARADHTHAFLTTGVIPNTYGSASSVGVFTVNAQGQLTGATGNAIQITESQVTNLVSDLASKVPTTTSVTAASGLIGGGNLSSNVTIGMPDVGTAGTYGSATEYPIITTDTKGRVTNVSVATLPGSKWQENINTATLVSNSAVTLTNISDLAVNVVAGRKYRIEVQIRYQTVATTTGIVVTLGSGGGSTGTIAGIANATVAGDGTASLFSGSITSLGDVVTFSGVPTANVDHLLTIQAVFVCTGSGTIIPQFRSEVSLSNVTVQVASNILAREWL